MFKFAKLTSYIFDGSYISIPIFFTICFFVTGNIVSALGWASLCVLFATLVPNLYILFLFKNNKINDLHVPNRGDRVKPLIITNISYLIGYFVLSIINAPLFLKSIFIIYIITTIILTAITSLWKISFHTSWITFVVVTFYVLLGKEVLFLLLFIPLVGWARVAIKRHTVMQVIMGSVISGVTSLFIYTYYKFIKII